MKHWRGAIHIHTAYSDGSGTMDEIVAAAKTAGLDYIIISDHDTLQAKRDGWEGYHDGVLIVAGVEIEPGTRTHLLGLGIDSIEGFEHMTGAECLERVKGRNGFSFLAHPEGAFRRNLGLDLEGWQCWGHPDYAGIELWSFMHDWIKGFQWFRIRNFHRKPLNKIAGPAPGLLARWDALNRERLVVGIASLDAHAKRFLGMTFFPYKFLFQTTLTYVLAGEPTGDGPADVRMLLESLAGGRAYLAYEPYERADRFEFFAAGAGEKFLMGDRIALARVERLAGTMPESCQVRLLCNGRVVEEFHAEDFEFDELEAGVWRVEASLEGYPWIFSNPITLL